ncbi:MAG: glycosyltransferase family 4 protein [Chryseolinea sp.]
MNKARLVIVNSNYPNENNKYGDVFVHSRLKHYTGFFDIRVVGWKKRIEDYSFEYEGIHVDVVNTDDKLVNKLKGYTPDVIGFHFVEGWMFEKIIKPFNVPIFIWVHGGEALGWYRRLFMFSLGNIYPFSKYVARNVIQMFQFHNFIKYANQDVSKKVQFIFVSKWMRSITEADTLSRIMNVEYIPNPIDPLVFKYSAKTAAHRKRILLIRSFDSKKYANDVAIDAILKLSRKDFFKELSFDIYGVGKYFGPLTNLIQNLPNVKLNNYFLENKNIPEIHKDHGIFLCPTRQDAQGVSMCEAMSSGLVPISSDNTAIPEFVTDQVSGFLTRSADDIANAIEFLYLNPERFLEMSKKASEHIQFISGTHTVVTREVNLLLKSLGREDSLEKIYRSGL